MNGEETKALIDLSEKVGTVTGTMNTFMKQQNIANAEQVERDSVLFNKVDDIVGCVHTHEGKITNLQKDVNDLHDIKNDSAEGLASALRTIWKIITFWK